jgi:DNA-binding NarL/FixJ family response regulator
VVITGDGRLWSRISRMLAARASVSRLNGTPVAAAELVDLVVLDVEEVDGAVLARLRQLADLFGSGVRVVLICQRLNARGLRRALDAGVSGLLLDRQIETALRPTIEAALAGQVSIPRDHGALLHRRPLSFREKQILGLAILGYTNSQIGGRLFLAESTVKSHLSSSFTKLGVCSRSEAAARVSDPEEPLGAEIMRIAARFDRAAAAPAV